VIPPGADASGSPGARGCGAIKAADRKTSNAPPTSPCRKVMLPTSWWSFGFRSVVGCDALGCRASSNSWMLFENYGSESRLKPELQRGALAGWLS
jgi:hypothetical protein